MIRASFEAAILMTVPGMPTSALSCPCLSSIVGAREFSICTFAHIVYLRSAIQRQYVQADECRFVVVWLQCVNQPVAEKRWETVKVMLNTQRNTEMLRKETSMRHRCLNKTGVRYDRASSSLSHSIVLNIAESGALGAGT